MATKPPTSNYVFYFLGGNIFSSCDIYSFLAPAESSVVSPAAIAWTLWTLGTRFVAPGHLAVEELVGTQWDGIRHGINNCCSWEYMFDGILSTYKW